MDGTLANIMLFAGNFAPRTWALCNGQSLSIASNTALFSLIGTTYGGDGQTTFKLPNFQGRVPVGMGQGTGLQGKYALGQIGGATKVTMTQANLPPHTHNAQVTIQLPALNGTGNGQSPEGAYPASITGVNAYSATSQPGEVMGAPTISTSMMPAGGNQPINIMMPYLALNYIICVAGIFPSRN